MLVRGEGVLPEKWTCAIQVKGAKAQRSDVPGTFQEKRQAQAELQWKGRRKGRGTLGQAACHPLLLCTVWHPVFWCKLLGSHSEVLGQGKGLARAEHIP